MLVQKVDFHNTYGGVSLKFKDDIFTAEAKVRKELKVGIGLSANGKNIVHRHHLKERIPLK